MAAVPSRVRRALASIPGARPLVHAVRRGWARRWDQSAKKQKVAVYWDSQADARNCGQRTWLDSQWVLEEYVFPHFGGRDWYAYLRDRYGRPTRSRALSLCCGNGELERALQGALVCSNFEGVDLSPKAIEVCRREAAQLPPSFSYRVADVEHLSLPEHHYDLVLGWMALHHIQGLSRLFAQVRRALQPRGIFVVNEYVGPARFRATGAQARLLQEALALLPPDLRRDPSGDAKENALPPPPEAVAALDPSEAISSDRILPLLAKHFATVERIDYGGTLLQWVLLDIIGNFDSEVAEHRACLKRLFDFEREALRAGLIQSDFSFVIAEQR